jgi:hypothetical protein
MTFFVAAGLLLRAAMSTIGAMSWLFNHRGIGRNEAGRFFRASKFSNAHRALFERSAWQLQSVPNPHQIGQRFRLHFAHDQASADFDGDFADIEFAGDLLVEKPLND